MAIRNIREIGDPVLNKNCKEVKEMTVQENYSISDFGGIGRNTNTKTEVFTNIKDSKKIFNLENKVDELLNDCVDELIRVKEVLIKRYENVKLI